MKGNQLPKLTPTAYSLAQVSWEDAAKMAYEENAGSLMCYTVGYLVRNDKKQVRLAQDVNAEGGVRDIVTIPRAYVRALRIVEKDSILLFPQAVAVRTNGKSRKRR